MSPHARAPRFAPPRAPLTQTPAFMPLFRVVLCRAMPGRPEGDVSLETAPARGSPRRSQ